MLRPMASGIFSDAHKLFIRQSYLQRMQQPADITVALNRKFQTTFVTKSVSRFINNNGLSKRRKEIQDRVDAQLSKSNAAIANEVHAKIQGKFAERAAQTASKAFDFADKAHDAKTLASAAGAAKTMVSLYLMCSGISTTAGAGGPRATTFNFNFATMVPVKDEDAEAQRLAKAQQVVEVELASAAAEDDLTDDGEDEGEGGEAA